MQLPISPVVYITYVLPWDSLVSGVTGVSYPKNSLPIHDCILYLLHFSKDILGQQE